MFTSLIEEFQTHRVIDFNTAKDWKGAQFAYRLREEYDDEVKNSQRLATLLAQQNSDQLESLIIGAWTGAFEGGESDEFVAELAAAAPKLPGLRHLFFGEMTYEECEVSWINQSDLSPLLRAFPKLESLRVRGGTGLSFAKVRHDALCELAIETGGLSSSALREIFQCEFPNLEHLELLLGEANYGFDGGIEDLDPLLSGRVFPKLRFLGLMNSEIANDIAGALVNAPIVGRIESIDISMGNLDGEGIAALHGLANRTHLKQLNVSHHYASDAETLALSKALPFKVIADDRQEPEDEWRPIVHAE